MQALEWVAIVGFRRPRSEVRIEDENWVLLEVFLLVQGTAVNLRLAVVLAVLTVARRAVCIARLPEAYSPAYPELAVDSSVLVV